MYSERNDPISGSNLWVTGRMRVVTPRPNSAWPPDAGIVFAGATKLPRMGLETFVLADQSDTLQVAIRGTGGAGDHTVFTSLPLSDAPIRFKLQFAAGQLTLSVGNMTATRSVGSAEITRVNLYCSSSHIYFSDVLEGADP